MEFEVKVTVDSEDVVDMLWSDDPETPPHTTYAFKVVMAIADRLGIPVMSLQGQIAKRSLTQDVLRALEDIDLETVPTVRDLQMEILKEPTFSNSKTVLSDLDDEELIHVFFDAVTEATIREMDITRRLGRQEGGN